jgi:cytochrome c-type biogenesis protein CcmH/NrfF
MTHFTQKAKSRSGGIAKAENEDATKLAEQHDKIRYAASNLIKEGTAKRNVAGILAKRYGLSVRHIRNILNSD